MIGIPDSCCRSDPKQTNDGKNSSLPGGVFPIMPQVAVTQPWIVGYNGENRLGDVDSYVIVARLWIDQAMKAEMGR